MEPSESLVSMRGWLKQKTSPFRFDHTAFCVVTDSEFKIYGDEEMKSLEMEIQLKQIHSVSTLQSSSRPGFQFLTETSFTFYCSTPHQTQRWLCALQAEPMNEKVNIDCFDLIKVIGIGSSGKVFLARMKHTGELFAIKAIAKDVHTMGNKESRVRAERNVLMRCCHQFITRLFYAFQTSSKLYFVLEYVSGGDLRHHIDKGVEFSRSTVRLYLAEIALALRTLHSLGIIYRDLKPENILISCDGHIKLADFGLAREIDDENCATSLCGTCEYLPPEVLRGERQTFSVDWWEFGVVAYQLLVGTLPFRSANRSRLFEMISSGNFRIPPSLDKVASNFLTELLKTDPTKRLGSVGTNVCGHEFFSGIDWKKVEEKCYVPEFIPDVPAADAVNNFDETYTEMPPTDSFVEPSSLQVNLADFSYVNREEFSPRAPSFDGEKVDVN